MSERTLKKFEFFVPLSQEKLERTRLLEVDQVRRDLKGEERDEALDAELAELQKEQEGAKYILMCQKLTRGQYQNVLKNAEPKGDDPLDSSLGYDTDVFGALLIRQSAVALFDSSGEDVLDEKLDSVLDGETGMSLEKFMHIFEELLNWQKAESERGLNLWGLSV